MTSRLAGSARGRPVEANAIQGQDGNHAFSAIDWKPEHCTGLKKNGEACPAKCVKGTLFCIGHTRANAKQK